MENPGLKLRNGSLDTQFRSVDEVQDMIRHLQKIEEDMLRNGVSGNKSWCSSFEDLSLLQDTEFHIDDNETEWLVKFPGAKHTRAKDLESDESFIDGGLLNVRYGLLNLVKSALIEQKTAKFKSPPSISASSVNYLTITRKRNPPYIARNSPPRFDPEPVQSNAETNYGYNSGNGTSEFVSPPKTTVNTFNFLSPTRPSTFLDNLREREPDLDFLYASTPAKQIDSRTYTRPKKNRLPLDTHHITRDIPISPIRGSGAPEAAEPAPPAVGADQLSHVNMNETYVATDDAENQKESSDSSPPRRVTRNLSYVIRRDSDSPNNNSPSHPTENNESPPADLNSTFVRSREDVYSPSPTGSSNSIHTSSMEELHNMARMQEQTLRMSSGKVLTRKDTHIVHPESAGFRALPKTAMESQIPGQSKLRIHSRIPAPGLGSRIRPPMNGARRPIANGGIRRPPDWQDDGAY